MEEQYPAASYYVMPQLGHLCLPASRTLLTPLKPLAHRTLNSSGADRRCRLGGIVATLASWFSGGGNPTLLARWDPARVVRLRRLRLLYRLSGAALEPSAATRRVFTVGASVAWIAP